MTGAELIAAERQRQFDRERYYAAHDDLYQNDELIDAAIAYLGHCRVTPDTAICKVNFKYDFPAGGAMFSVADPWPWDESHDKRRKHSRRRLLEIAGALIAAELDRDLRANP